MNVAIPLLNFVVTAALQFLVPSLLQTKLSAAAYVAYVVVSSAAGYIGMADGGLWLPILRELTALHGGNSLSQYVGELRRSNRVYVFASCAGLTVGVAAFLLARPSLGEAWFELSFLLASMATLAAVAFRFWTSSFYVAILSSTTRYLFGQVILILNLLVPAVLLSIGLVVWRDLTVAFWLYAASIAAQGLLEGLAAWQLYRRDFAAVEPAVPPRGLKDMLSDGLSIRIGEQLVTFGLPYALTILGGALVPIAIPARTLSNSCRLICQQFVNLLGIRITRLVAQSGANSSKTNNEYQVSAKILSAMQLVLVGMVDLAARPIFDLWLPRVAPQIRPHMAGLMADQILLSAVLPASIVFLVHGKLRPWGLSKLYGALGALGVLVVAVRFNRTAAFGLAHVASSLPAFALCAWAELGGHCGFSNPVAATKLRYARSLLLAAAYLTYPTQWWIVPMLAILTSLPSLLGSLREARVLLVRPA